MNIGTASYNGLNFGTGTKIQVMEISGLDDIPDLRSIDVARSQAHGSRAGRHFTSNRLITMKLLLKGTSNADYVAMLESVKTAFVPQELAFLPLLINDSTRLVFCRPLHRSPEYDATWQATFGYVDVQLEALDPRIYDANLQSFVIPVGVSSGGFAFPLSFPLSFGSSGTSGSIQATNAGNWQTFPTATIFGPVDNPTLENVAEGKHITFALSLSNTDTLVLDFDNRTALLNGTASRRNTLTSDSLWWDLQPGTQQINYRANTVQVGSTCQFQFRSAYM